MKMNLEKFKSDKKFRSTVLCSVIGLILVIAVSVAVPIGVHNSNIKKATISEQAASTEPETINEIETEPETEASEPETTEPTTAEITEPSKVTPPNANKSSSSDKSSPAKEKPTQKSSGSKSSGTPKQETVTASAQTTEHVWTQAEVDELVNEALVYARKRGFTINSGLTTIGTSWRTPATTYLPKTRIQSRLKYLIDQSYDGVVNCLGYFDPKAEINVLAIQCAENEWEIYVVY